ncbi:MAG: SAM-dependent methyltransferase [Chloroflexi bacterium]|nr:SAM-dependent methyltransferase [Chloroflexota bacterium]
MTVRPAVEGEIRQQILQHGRITFAQFMQACLYSPAGGFYTARGEGIGDHFGTSSTGHPVFGALIARQLEQMWRILGAPAVFHVVEAGSGDGLLAESIVNTCQRVFPEFARALRYVATDYAPGLIPSHSASFGWVADTIDGLPPGGTDGGPQIQRVKTEGLRPFHGVVGCILCNELMDNFPVHRFAIQDGKVKEIFVTLEGEDFEEVLDEPSSPLIEERLSGLGLSLPEGYRGEVNLALEDWTGQLATALERGFVLTIDYGQPAAELYSATNDRGTLVCYSRHAVSDDAFQDVGRQDITCQVDFTALTRCGERQGLTTEGFTTQREFLNNLGFLSYLADLDGQGLSAARREFNRTAMAALVDPEEYGGFRVLAQSRGVGPGEGLAGFGCR